MIEDGYSYCSNAWVLDTRIKNELQILLIISILCAKTGETYASNKYFSDLFGCTEVSISQKIKKLIELGYIYAEYEKRGCEVKSRKLRLKKFLTDDSKSFYPTIKKVFKDNNNSIVNNNTILMNSNSNISLALKKWIDYKKERGQSYKTAGLRACVEKLERLSNNDADLAMMIVDESISNNWAGLFPLKENKNKLSKAQEIEEHNLKHIQKLLKGKHNE